MSIKKIEVRFYNDPALIESQSGIPEIFEINQGPPGLNGPNSVTSATTSDGTANLSLSNVTTATATVTGTLNAAHIHGNIAGSVYAHVRAGENLAKGDPVYISGSHGSGASLIAIVSKADASNAAKMPAVGVMDAAVSANANGHMVITGTISDIDTNAYAVNSVLYVASGGGWTSTPPAANSQPVAIVERSNTNNGAVIVKVNGLASYGGNGASDANKLVRFGSDGSITVSSTLDSLLATTSDGTAVAATATDSGIAVFAESLNQFSVIARSTNSTGLLASSSYGSYIAEFENLNVIESAIERVRGWFVWFYNTFTGRLKTADITANRDWTLPNKSGTILLDSDLGTNVATFLATPTSANLAAAVTDETGTGSLVFAQNSTLSGTTLNSLDRNTLGRIAALTMSQSPPCSLFEDFCGTSGTGIFSWTTSGTGSDSIGSVGQNSFGVRRMTTGTTSGNQRRTILPIPTSTIFGTEIRAHFAIPDVTTMSVNIGMEQTSGAFGRYLLTYNSGVNSGFWYLITGTGAGSTTNFGTNGPSNGNFASGKRYRSILRPVNATTVYVKIDEADWNTDNWTNMFDGNVTIASYTPNSDPIALDFRVNTTTNAARSLDLDYASVENTSIVR